MITTAILSILVAGGGVLGLSAGAYSGSGTLESQTFMVPNMHFKSVRTLSDGVIHARTQADLGGFPAAKAGADLRVQPTATGFDLIDVTTNSKAGEGSCSAQSCTFTATVQNGSLTLTETWIPTPTGFNVVSGSQSFNGLKATYSGIFTRN